MEKIPIAVKKTQSNDVIEFKNRKKKSNPRLSDNKQDKVIKFDFDNIIINMLFFKHNK